MNFSLSSQINLCKKQVIRLRIRWENDIGQGIQILKWINIV